MCVMCVRENRCSKAMAHMWRSEGNFQDLVLSFHEAFLGLNSDHQLSWQARSPAKPSCQPNLNLYREVAHTTMAIGKTDDLCLSG